MEGDHSNPINDEPISDAEQDQPNQDEHVPQSRNMYDLSSLNDDETVSFACIVFSHVF
jgi:hypothetical protein